MQRRLAHSLVGVAAALALAGCGDGHEPTIVQTEIVQCPPRAPAPTCILELPVDVSDPFALHAYVRAATPREGSEKTAEALKGWARCAAEVRPFRAGHSECKVDPDQ